MLTPDYTYTANGVRVNSKIIPDGTKWKDAAKAKAAGFSAGSLYKKQQQLSGGTGLVQEVTVHTTDDLANVSDDAEQYSRATFNENMGSARVHFYVDELGAWQNLKAGTGMTPNDPKGSAEVGWHAGDGSSATGGNMISLAIEIVMNDNEAHDAKAYDNGARLAAWLLHINGLQIDDLVTHAYWNAKAAGISRADIDEQCVEYVSGKHWCPYYIFNAKNTAAAKQNWIKFKKKVQAYLDELKKPSGTATAPKHPFVDVPASAWYAADVQWGWENEIINGEDATHFNPNKNITKAEALTMIRRAVGMLQK